VLPPVSGSRRADAEGLAEALPCREASGNRPGPFFRAVAGLARPETQEFINRFLERDQELPLFRVFGLDKLNRESRRADSNC
jgi:hypothetical protein